MKKVYFIQCGDGGPIKIGISQNPEKRIYGLQTANPAPLFLLAATSAETAWERMLHKILADHRISHEWFRPATQVMEMVEAAKDGRLGEVLFPTPEKSVVEYAEVPDFVIERIAPVVQHDTTTYSDILASSRKRIAKILSRPGISKSLIAGRAGVHRNSLARMASPKWNPNGKTLDAIMDVVDWLETAPNL